MGDTEGTKTYIFFLGYIQPVNCGVRFAFICKRSPDQLLHEAPTNWRHYLPQDYFDNLPSSCPEGFTDIATKCIRYDHENMPELSWSQAQHFCSLRYESSLASFHDNSEILQIFDMYSETFATSENWIGLEWRGSRSMVWTDN